MADNILDEADRWEMRPFPIYRLVTAQKEVLCIQMTLGGAFVYTRPYTSTSKHILAVQLLLQK
jgi:hypothetical protein